MGAFPQKLKVTHRRYVIDETLGAVSVFHNFPWLDAGLPVDPGDPGQPDVPRRGRQEPLHSRGDGLRDARMQQSEAGRRLRETNPLPIAYACTWQVGPLVAD